MKKTRDLIDGRNPNAEFTPEAWFQAQAESRDMQTRLWQAARENIGARALGGK